MGGGRAPSTPAPNGGLLRRVAGRLGLGGEAEVTFLTALQSGGTYFRPTRPIVPRDATTTRADVSVEKDAATIPGLRAPAGLFKGACSPELSELLDRTSRALRSAPHLSALSETEGLLASTALLQAIGTGTGDLSAARPMLEKAASAFAAAQFVPEEHRELDRETVLCAARAVRMLAAAGGSGVTVAKAAFGVSGAAGDRRASMREDQWVLALLATADALDPQRTRSLREIDGIATRTVKDLIPARHYTVNGNVLQFQDDFKLDDWASAGELLRNGHPESSVRNRIPAVAFCALLRSEGSQPSDLERSPSEVERAAVAAVRNGLTHDLDGSNLAYAKHRTSKLSRYLERLRNGLRARMGDSRNPFKGALALGSLIYARLRHPRSPLNGAVRFGAMKRPENIISPMRATKDSARQMAGIFGNLLQAFESLDPQSRKEAAANRSRMQEDLEKNAPYLTVLLRHWGERFITTQQLDTQLAPEEQLAIWSELERTPGAGRRALDRWNGLLQEQTLDPRYLERTGWNLVAYLRESIELVEGQGARPSRSGTDTPARVDPPPPDAPAAGSGRVVEARLRRSIRNATAASDPVARPDTGPSARTRVAIGIVRHLAGERTGAGEDGAPPPLAYDAQTLARARESLDRLKSSLLRINPGGVDEPVHPERTRTVAERSGTGPADDTREARLDDPIGFLARQVRDFELGSSVMLSNGGVLGPNLPFGAGTAWAPVTPVQALGRARYNARNEAVISATLSSAGGEIFLGTARSRLGELSAGAAKGFGVAGGLLVGVGGSTGVKVETTQRQGVFLRIPRNGEADAGSGRETPSGLDGDDVVARRMSDVLSAINRRSEGEPDERLLLRLLAEFPELSVSVVRDDAPDIEVRPMIVRAEAGGGLYSTLTHSGRVAGVGVDVEFDARKQYARRIETGGRSNVAVRSGGRSMKTSVGAGAVGIVGGSGADVIGARSTVARSGRIEATTLLRQEGLHSLSSFHVRTTPRLDQFKEDVLAAMPGLVEFSLTRDERQAALVDVRRATRPGDMDEETVRQNERDRMAGTLMNGLRNMKHDPDVVYTTFSMLRPAAANTLDGLHALGNLVRDDPSLAAIAALLDGEYERVATDEHSYRGAYGFQTKEGVDKRSVGNQVLFDLKNRTLVRWTGVSSVI